MSKQFYSEEKAGEILHQLEDILDLDPLIDELGYIHPSQFSLLSKQSGSSHSSSEKSEHQSAARISSAAELVVNASDQDERYFWSCDHKLGISIHVLLPLYKAAKHAFMTTFKQYKSLTNEANKVGNSSPAFSSSQDHLESILMKHSRSLLLLSSDFMTAWNYRKLVVSRRKQPSMFMDELLLSALVLSYSPKSEQAWNQRRWVIRSISANCSNFKEVLRKESELVEKIAERSKMNYRAWNYRSWLVSYMTTEQVLHELKKSRGWAALHVADNCCFHYRKRLLLKIYKDKSCMEETFSSGCIEIDHAWKDELEWNETLIKQFVGREALWLHRRFLSVFWINDFLTDSLEASNHSKETFGVYNNLDSFLENELCLLRSCLTIVDNDYEDFQSQATHSASYILWLKMQVSKPLGIKLLEKLKEFDLKTLLCKSWPERSSLYNYIMT